jgi:hypothetical protein
MEIKYLCIILSRSNIFVFQIDFCDSQPKKKKQFAQCFFYWFKMPSHITFCWFIEHVFSWRNLSTCTVQFWRGYLLPCSHTVNLACTMFLFHTTWYSKLLNFFLCGVDHLHTTKVFNDQLNSRNFTIKRKTKAFGTPQKSGTPNWPVQNSSQLDWLELVQGSYLPNVCSMPRSLVPICEKKFRWIWWMELWR